MPTYTIPELKLREFIEHLKREDAKVRRWLVRVRLGEVYYVVETDRDVGYEG